MPTTTMIPMPTEVPHPLFKCPMAVNTSTFIVHRKDCAKFYYCRKKEKYADLGICATGLWFSIVEEKCVEPWNDACSI